MKKITVLIISLCFFLKGSSQNTQPVNDSTAKADLIKEIMPEFPGGTTALMNYIKASIQYPSADIAKKTEGIVKVSFIVDKEGNATNAEVIQSVSEGLDKEAIRIVNSMPKWTPGKQNGNNVAVKYSLPIPFYMGGTYRVPINPVAAPDPEYLNYYNAGVNYMKEKKYDEAVESFTKALREKPKDIDSHYNRGVCYRALKQDNDACEDWNKVKSLGDETVNELLDKYCK